MPDNLTYHLSEQEYLESLKKKAENLKSFALLSTKDKNELY